MSNKPQRVFLKAEEMKDGWYVKVEQTIFADTHKDVLELITEQRLHRVVDDKSEGKNRIIQAEYRA